MKNAITLNLENAIKAINAVDPSLTKADMHITYIKNGGTVYYPSIVDGKAKLCHISFRHDNVLAAREAKKVERAQIKAAKLEAKKAATVNAVNTVTAIGQL